MATDDADDDDLVLFQDVTVIRSTAPALLCRIGGQNVWLPRSHVSGKLWCTGDRGKLFIRRWVARDRGLIDLAGAMIGSRPRLPGALHVLRADRNADHAKRGPHIARRERRDAPDRELACGVVCASCSYASGRRRGDDGFPARRQRTRICAAGGPRRGPAFGLSFATDSVRP